MSDKHLKGDDKKSDEEKSKDELIEEVRDLRRQLDEGRRMAESLRERESLLDQVGEIAQIGGWEMDIATGNATWTRATYDIIEIEPGQSIPSMREHIEFYLPEYRPMVKEAMRALIEEDLPLEYEAPYRTAKGNLKWCRASGRAIRENGKCVKVQGVLQNITERKTAEEELRKSRELYQFVAENASDNIWMLSLADLRITYSSPSCEKMFGFTPEESMRMSLEEQLTPDALETIRSVLTEELARESDPDAEPERARMVEVEQFVKGGGTIWTEVKASFIRDTTGKAVSLLGITRDITARKIAESALRESEARFHAYIDHSPLGIFVADAQGRYIDVNPAACDMTGYSSEELTSMSIAELSRPTQTKDDVIREFSEVQEKSRFSGEVELIRKDGSLLSVNLEAVALSGERFMAFCTDITDRKNAERALLYSENLFRRVFDLIPVGLWIADKEGTLQHGNPAGVRIWGAELSVPQEEYGFFKARRLPSGEQVAPKDWALAHTVNEGVTISDELLEIDAFDGEKRVILNYTAPILGEKGDTLAAIVVNHDVTKQYRAEEALAASNRFLQTVLDNMPSPVFFIDPQGIFLGCNRAFELYFGKPRTQIVGRSVEEIAPREVAPDFRRADIDLLQQGEGVQTYETKLRFADGLDRNVLFHKALFDDPQGDPAGIVGVMLDITELRTLEEQLLQSQKMEGIGRLAGGVAHDFNNMLTVINNYGDMIAENLAEHDPMRQDVEEIRRASRRATELTQQLLAFSRKQTIQPQVFDLNEAITRSEKILQRLIGEDINLVFLPTQGLPNVRFDPGQLDQILFNLAANSRDAMPHGGNLVIGTEDAVLDEDYSRQHANTPPGKCVVLSISDTGNGMDEQTRRNIFEPFFTTKGVGEGTGLGLSTVYGIVKQHGGSIDVYSDLGEGTTFRIYLPAIEEEAARRTSHLSAEAPPGQETILLVEDDPSVLRIAERILESHGYKVILATSPGDAILECQKAKGNIHLVLTDVVMPNMNGKECFEKLREIRPDLKVLYMSGYTENAIAHRGVLDHGTAFIQKPFTVAELTRKVRMVLDDGVEDST